MLSFKVDAVINYTSTIQIIQRFRNREGPVVSTGREDWKLVLILAEWVWMKLGILYWADV